MVGQRDNPGGLAEAARGLPYDQAKQTPAVKRESGDQVEGGQQQIDPRKVAEHPDQWSRQGAAGEDLDGPEQRRQDATGDRPYHRDQELVAWPARFHPGPPMIMTPPPIR